MPDFASAARRVADALMRHERPYDDDLRALLPAIRAVAALGSSGGQRASDEGSRLSDYAMALCRAAGAHHPDLFLAQARAAMALADAEAAARAAEGWAAYEAARDAAFVGAGAIHNVEGPKARLDAAVRRLAGLPDP